MTDRQRWLLVFISDICQCQCLGLVGSFKNAYLVLEDARAAAAL